MAFPPPNPAGPVGVGPRPPQPGPPSMGGPLPPPAAMPPPPPPPIAGGGPATPFAGMLADLPASLPAGWQSVDLAIRATKTAMRAADMQLSPKVVAVLQSVTNTLEKLLSGYTTGTPGSSVVSTSADQSLGSPPSADADAMPAPGAGSDETSGSE